MNRVLIFAFCITIAPGFAAAQTVWDIFTDPLVLAKEYYQNQEYEQAIAFYKKSYAKTPSDSVALFLSRSYVKLGDSENSVLWFDNVQNENLLTKDDLLQKAIALTKEGHYAKASAIYKRLGNISGHDFSDAVQSLDNINHLYKDSSLYRIRAVNFNTKYAEISPAFYEDGILFSSSRNNKLWKKGLSLNDTSFDLFFTSMSQDTIADMPTFAKPVLLSDKINSKWNERTPVIFNHGKSMLFSRNEVTAKGQSLSRIFHSENNGNGWSVAEPLSIGDADISMAHPAINEEGTKLYFASDMPGGFGGVDLYIVEKVGSEWGKPQNLGPAINSPGNEIFPYFHENKTLYFSSNGHGGLGGLDIFSTYVEDDSTIQLVNLGYPINSSSDDFGIILNPIATSGYFSSTRTDGSNDDIFYIGINKDQFRYSISGTVFLDQSRFDKENPIVPEPEVPVYVVDRQTADTVAVELTSAEGKFLFTLPWSANYNLLAQRKTGAVNLTHLRLPENHPIDKNFTIVFIPSLREIMEGQSEKSMK